MNVPDLFESGELQLEKKGQSKPAFLREFMPEYRFSGIARNYKALQAASRLARFFEINLVHMEFYDSAWQLLHTALDSFSNKKQSEVILLKSLYVFARIEGYPVKENWLLKLPQGVRMEISGTINAPVGTTDPGPDKVSQWVHQLEQYFIQHTDFLLPD